MKRKAFTLIELIIVIVVLGILATIAIVGYRAVIDRANQSSAENAAKSFDRQIRAQAAFGIDGNPNQTNPRRGQLIVDMLQDPAASTTAIKDIPDADVATASLTSNSLRVLVWNHNIVSSATTNWVRVCKATGCSPTAPTTEATTVGSIPLGVTTTVTTAEQFCFAFRKGGQTVYLGLSEKANIPGIVSTTVGTACTGSETSTAGVTTTGYTNGTPIAPSAATPGYALQGGLAITTDSSW